MPTRRQRSPFNVGARLVVHQEGRYNHPAFHYRRLVHHLLRLGRRLRSECSQRIKWIQSILAKIGGAIAWIFAPLGWGNWQAAVASITGLVAKENIVGTIGILYGGGDASVYQNIAAAFTGVTAYSFLVFNLLCAPCFAAIGAIKREMNSAEVDLVCNRLSVRLCLRHSSYDKSVRRLVHRQCKCYRSYLRGCVACAYSLHAVPSL